MLYEKQRESGVVLSVLEFKVGSKDHRLAEEMVREGLLDRAPLGGYCLPGRVSKEW